VEGAAQASAGSAEEASAAVVPEAIGNFLSCFRWSHLLGPEEKGTLCVVDS